MCVCVNITLLLAFLFLTPANAANDYSFTTIDIPGAVGIGTNGINNVGQIVGGLNFGGPTQGAIFSGDTFTTFLFPGAVDSEALGVNDSGQIVGQYGFCCGAGNHGFLRLSDGSFENIDPDGSRSTSAVGIDNAGQIVGLYDDGGTFHGFLRRTDGSFTPPIDFPGAVDTTAYGINDAGQIVGTYRAGDGTYHGFLLTNGSFTTIDFPGAIATFVNGINNVGEIVGSYSPAGVPPTLPNSGFLFSGGSFTTILFPDASRTEARGINDAGQIVGNSTSSAHNFLATPLVITTSSSGPTPPSGFSLGDPPTYYDVTNTAGFSGPQTVCIRYDPAKYLDLNNLRLLHYENNAWVDVTTSNDAANYVICGQVTSLSPFAIAEEGMFLRVSVDIKPGSFPNSINLGSGGTVPVAIFSTTTFDARTVEPASVTLASAPVALKGKGTYMYSFQDVNKDGLLDLVVHVTTSALQLSESDREAIIEGKTFGGTVIKGKDSVRVVP